MLSSCGGGLDRTLARLEQPVVDGGIPGDKDQSGDDQQHDAHHRHQGTIQSALLIASQILCCCVRLDAR